MIYALITSAALAISYLLGHWIGWGRGYEAGRCTGYLHGREDQEYEYCRDQEDLAALMRRVQDYERN